MGPHLLYRVQKRGKEVQTVKVYGKRFVSICIDFEWAGPGTFIRTLQQCRSWDLFVETVVVEANQLDLGGRWTKNQEKKGYTDQKNPEISNQKGGDFFNHP